MHVALLLINSEDTCNVIYVHTRQRQNQEIVVYSNQNLRKVQNLHLFTSVIILKSRETKTSLWLTFNVCIAVCLRCTGTCNVNNK